MHVLGWILFMSLPILFMSEWYNGESMFRLVKSPYYWLFFSCYALVFYLHAKLLFPLLFLEKKYMGYGVSLAILFACILVLKPFDKLVSEKMQQQQQGFEGGSKARPLPPPKPPESSAPMRHPEENMRPDQPGGFRSENRGQPPGRMNQRRFDIISVFLYFFTIALGVALETARRWRLSEQRTAQAETQRAKAELYILKAQINPHFLFNTLNNIYGLSVSQHPETSASILRLSNMLRYLTEETTSDLVALEDELNCLNDFIALQKLRIGKKMQVFVTTKVEDSSFPVPPLVLMTFVENAFKFGTSNHEAADITIHINQAHNTLQFFCSNKIFPNRTNLEGTQTGLENTHKRLGFLYGDRHRLDVSTENGHFTVLLTLPKH
ncbi:MAG: sensor histidine kinase [Chitinophagaceae bacterium]